MSSDIYIYKMTAVPREQVGAVGRMLGVKLTPTTFIKTELYQSKTKWLDIEAGEYSLETLKAAASDVGKVDKAEREMLLKALDKAPPQIDEWLVVEIDYDY